MWLKDGLYIGSRGLRDGKKEQAGKIKLGNINVCRVYSLWDTWQTLGGKGNREKNGRLPSIN
jgi:hypothetical protein